MTVCPFCSLVIAPFDPQRRHVPGTNVPCHGYCHDEAVANAQRRIERSQREAVEELMRVPSTYKLWPH